MSRIVPRTFDAGFRPHTAIGCPSDCTVKRSGADTGVGAAGVAGPGAGGRVGGGV